VLLTKVKRPRPKRRPSSSLGAADEPIVPLTKVKSPKPRTTTSSRLASGPVSALQEGATQQTVGVPQQSAKAAKTGKWAAQGPKPWKPPSGQAAEALKFGKKKNTLLGLPAISGHGKPARRPAPGQPGRQAHETVPATGAAQSTTETAGRRQESAWRAPAVASQPRLARRSREYDLASKELSSTNKRDQVGTALVKYLNTFCDVAMYLVTQQHRLVLKNLRGGPLPEKIAREQIRIALDEESILTQVVTGRCPYQGPLGNRPADRLVAKALSPSNTILSVFPVLLRNRVVAVLCGSGGQVPQDEVAELVVHAESAYERILLDRRQSST